MFWQELRKLRSCRSWGNYVLAGIEEITFPQELGKLRSGRSLVNYVPTGFL